MMKLSENFTLEEMTASDTARRFSIGNEPRPEHVANLKLLCENILQPLRDKYGKPIRVTSGYRSPALNKAIGGVKNSQHTQGQAADITTFSRNGNKRLFELAQSLELPFDQLIDERNYRWLHVSYRNDGKNRRQILHLT